MGNASAPGIFANHAAIAIMAQSGPPSVRDIARHLSQLVSVARPLKHAIHYERIPLVKPDCRIMGAVWIARMAFL